MKSLIAVRLAPTQKQLRAGVDNWRHAALDFLTSAMTLTFVLAMAPSGVTHRVAMAQNAPSASRTPDVQAENSAATTTPALQNIALDVSPPGAREMLALVIGEKTETTGQPKKVMIFLVRTKNDGWETIGVRDRTELRRHWLTVAAQRISGVDLSALSADDQLAGAQAIGLDDVPQANDLEQTAHQRKILLAVDLSIQRFIRAYEQAEHELSEQLSDRNLAQEVLTKHQTFVDLRNLGIRGLFGDDSLTARIIRSHPQNTEEFDAQDAQR